MSSMSHITPEESATPKRILIVDDEPAVVTLLQEVFHTAGYTTTVATDGQAGLSLALKEDFDAIVLDWVLPEMEGPEVCQRLQNAGITSPILMLSVKQQLQDRVFGLDSGADDFLTKPFAVEELTARIRALLRRTARHVESKRLSYADLTVDTQRHVAQRADQQLQLTSREFMLLQHLMKHAEQILSREEIAEAVWGQGLDNLSNVVDLYIHYLRRKVERPGLPRLIRTVRGIGYTLRAGDLKANQTEEAPIESAEFK
jgi:DNA-binding response OmpR family regulator